MAIGTLQTEGDLRAFLQRELGDLPTLVRQLQGALATVETTLVGPAGGVLSGTFPDPGFAVDMATQAELNAHALLQGLASHIPSGGLLNAHVSGSAAIAYGKLALTLSIVNGDIASGAAIAYSKLVLTGSIVAADISATLKPSGSAAAGTEALRALGTSASTAAAGNDSRLSDARTPTAHHTTHEPGGTDPMAVDAAAATGSLRTLGSGAAQAAQGTDARFPVAGEKSALAGTSGTPGSGNKYVTDADARNSDSRTPTGAAGGVLGGTFPAPSFAVDMATQAELDAHAALKTGTHGIPSMSSGQGLLWNGSTWVATDLATQAELDTHAALQGTASHIPSAGVTASEVSAGLKPSGSAAAGTEALRALGTSASTAAAGNDSRLSDARAPTAHHTSHEAGGSDPITLLAAAVSDFNTAVRTNRADQLAALGADFSFNTHKGTNAVDPTSPQDVSTKHYTDGLAFPLKGLAWLATDAALPAHTRSTSTLTASANGALTVDGVAAAAGDRVLVKDEGVGSPHLENGLYTVTAAGSAGTPWVMTRASDLDEAAEFAAGVMVLVMTGLKNGNTTWICTTPAPITVNTTALTFRPIGNVDSPVKIVRVSMNSNVTISNPGTATFDGVTLSAGERILLHGQSTGSQNGIYVFNGSATAMTRATDFDTSSEIITGAVVFVTEGTARNLSTFRLTTTGTITVGTTTLTFSERQKNQYGAIMYWGDSFGSARPRIWGDSDDSLSFSANGAVSVMGPSVFTIPWRIASVTDPVNPQDAATKNSSETYADTKIAKSLVDAKGDLIAATANDTVARLAVGADDTVLVADAAQATGQKWLKVGVSQTGAGSSGLAVGCFSAYLNSAQAATTGDRILFDTEEWDVSGWFDSTSTKGTFTPLVAGYYRFSARVESNPVITTDRTWVIDIAKNGTRIKQGQRMYERGNGVESMITGIVLANGSTDAFTILLRHSNGGTVAVQTGATATYFQGELIGKS